MKAKVFVQLKDGVLDPEGQTIAQALNRMNYSFVKDVRVGKVFEIEVENTDNLEAKIREFADKVLTNPIIERFDVVVEG